MPNYAIRLSFPYNDVSGVVAVWQEKCLGTVVFEHEMDEEVSTTHVHIALTGCQYATPEPLKRHFRKLIQTEAKGNALWSFKVWDGNQTYLTYMTKGKLAPCFARGMDVDWDSIRDKWVKLEVDPNDEKKMTKMMIVKAVHEYFAQRAPKDLFGKPEKGFEKLIPEMDIFACIRRKLIDFEQPLGLYKVVDIFDAFMMFYDKDRFLHNCRNVLEKRVPRI